LLVFHQNVENNWSIVIVVLLFPRLVRRVIIARLNQCKLLLIGKNSLRKTFCLQELSDWSFLSRVVLFWSRQFFAFKNRTIALFQVELIFSGFFLHKLKVISRIVPRRRQVVIFIDIVIVRLKTSNLKIVESRICARLYWLLTLATTLFHHKVYYRTLHNINRSRYFTSKFCLGLKSDEIEEITYPNS
jgi:hypothetical protein